MKLAETKGRKQKVTQTQSHSWISTTYNKYTHS